MRSPMLNSTTPEVLRRRRLTVAGVAAALLLIAVVTYAVVTCAVLVHRSASTTSPPSDDVAIAAIPNLGLGEQRAELDPLTPTSDPETFARQVAQAIFAWDTTSMVTRADQVEQLLALADPTGESTAGLMSDLDGYLPTADAWTRLAHYETQQWLTIAAVTPPTLWPAAESQAGPGLLPGTTVFTVDGVRHRSGVWEGEPVTSSHDVAFTVFMVCGPSYPRCHLLRLSMLDKPLH
jgi:hypothetical protein